MSRYEGLRAQYEKFRARAESMCVECERVPETLAGRLTAYLGCPAAFEGAAGPRPYVSPARVSRRGDALDLAPPDSGRIELSEDGRFYFALCVALEPAAGGPPQERFAVLLSARPRGAGMAVRVEDTIPKFEVELGEPDDERDLLGEICGVIEDALDADARGKKTKPAIGFVRYDL